MSGYPTIETVLEIMRSVHRRRTVDEFIASAEPGEDEYDLRNVTTSVHTYSMYVDYGFMNILIEEQSDGRFCIFADGDFWFDDLASAEKKAAEWVVSEFQE